MKKVILISIDGVRPDALTNSKYLDKLKAISAYSLKGKTAFPPVTLPCHVSMFHGVEPSRHGTTTNIYAPQVRPINGLCEVLSMAGKTCASFFSWNELRDLTKPASLIKCDYVSGEHYGFEYANEYVMKSSIAYLKENPVDFAFVYFGFPDEAGHQIGWMSEKYFYAIEHSLSCVFEVINALSSEYDIIITSDHGGHDRGHGDNIPEDMTIPLFIISENYGKGVEINDYCIIDIPKTIANMLGVTPCKDWEGKVL